MTALSAAMLYANQTAMLRWLRSLGHDVEFARDYSGGRRVRRIWPPRVRRHRAGPETVPAGSIGGAPIPTTSKLFPFVGSPCPYCGIAMTASGKRMASRDHKHPRSRGGRFAGANKIVCCMSCNGDKGSKTLREWWEKLTLHGDRRAERVAFLVFGAAPTEKPQQTESPR